LTFTYLVAAGDASSDLDYVSASALSVNGGAIKDAAGNDATLALPAPGTAGSLGTNKAIVIDTAVPSSSVNVPAEWKNADVQLTFACDGTGSACTKVFYTTDGSVPSTNSSSVDAAGNWKTTITDAGQYTIKYMAQDAAGNMEAVKTAANSVKIYKTAPITSNSPLSAAYNRDVIVTLTAADEASGVNETKYCIGAADCNPAAIYNSTDKVLVTAEGTNFVRYYSIDNAGNTEAIRSATVVIDKSAPVISDESPKGVIKDLDPVLSAKFTDVSAVDVSGVNVLVTGGAIEFNNDYFTINAAGVTSNISGIILAKNTTYKVTISGLKDVLGNATAAKPWTFTVSGDATAEDTAAPTATTYPADGAANVVTTISPTVTFSEQVDASTLSATNIQLKRFGTDETVPATIAVADGKVVTLDPTCDLAKGTQYYFAISGVNDLAGNAMTAWTAGNKTSHEFTTVPASINQFTIPLNPGWNLISLPLIPTNTSITEVLKGVADLSKIESVQYYDASTKTWSGYVPGYESSLTKLEDGKGYWIKVTGDTATSLTVSGKETLAGGKTTPLLYTIIGKVWNLIGFKSSTPKTAGEYISQMGDDDILWVYKDGEQTALRKNDTLEPGYGYWFYTYKDGFDIIPK
jgi:hypothetical protein